MVIHGHSELVTFNVSFRDEEQTTWNHGGQSVSDIGKPERVEESKCGKEW